MGETATIRAAARSDIYRFLACGFAGSQRQWHARLHREQQSLERALQLLDRRDEMRLAKRLRRLLDGSDAAALERAYVACFGHTVSTGCPPYETEYGQAHIFQKAHALADIAGFYRSFGLELASDFNDRVDHVSAELEFMHFLCLKEAYALAHAHTAERLALCRQAQATFLGEHLGRWAPAFASRLRQSAPGGLHAVMGELLASFVGADMQALRVEPTGALDAPSPQPVEEPAACERCAMAGSGLDGGEWP